MKKISEKVISLLLAASMTASLAACKKKGNDISQDGKSHSGQKITSDTPWYNSNIYEVKVSTDPGRQIEYTNSSAIGADDKNVIVFTRGYYKTPDNGNFSWDNYNYSDYLIAMISIIDRKTGETVNTIDLIPEIGPDGFVNSSRYENGQIFAVISSFNEKTYEEISKELTIDPVSGMVVDSKDLSGESTMGAENSFKLGDYRVDAETNWSGRTISYNLYINKPDGGTLSVELKDDNTDYYEIPAIIAKDATTALVPVSTDKGFIYFSLDLETGSITKEDAGDYEWLDIGKCYLPFTGTDGYVYFTEPTGISKIDFANKSCDIVFNYSWSNVNRSLLEDMYIIDATEDSFLLCGDNYSHNAYSLSNESTFTVIDFTRAAKNPNAGKHILELYSIYGYTDDKISDAILKFNETNSEYFIEVTDRYSQYDEYYSDLNSDDDFREAELNSEAAMSSRLAMDILNGEGPDILMNCSSYGQLNNDSYLVDLSAYVGDLDPDKYFTNIVDAARTDGKLYNLPVCYEIEGIHTDAKYAGKSGVGFTTEEYEKFLNDTLNGKDVITLGQAVYFAKLFNAMSEKFISNGRIDLTGPEFEELARFVKDNVPENAKAWDDYDDLSDGYSVGVGVKIFKGDLPLDSNLAAGYTTCYGMSGYLNDVYIYGGSTAVLGIPSADGRGPLVTPCLSVAVSAQAYNVDACGEFVKMLISDEVQKDLAMRDNFVLSREAFREGGRAAVEFYNGEGYDYYIGYDFGPDRKITFSDKTIDEMENIIMSCSNCSTADAPINLILIEEMPAYFSGQKDLASVVAIAQDRAQKVLDERK